MSERALRRESIRLLLGTMVTPVPGRLLSEEEREAIGVNRDADSEYVREMAIQTLADLLSEVMM